MAQFRPQVAASKRPGKVDSARAGALEFVQAELPDRLEHAESRLTEQVGAAREEILRDQRRQPFEQIRKTVSAQLQRGVESELTWTYRKSSKQRLLSRRKQIMTPSDRRGKVR
jgi:hypothetical protein